MPATILVTGALGNVGTEVIKSLQAKGAIVRAADLDEEKITKRFGPGVEAVRFDFTNPQTYTRTFQSIEKMFLVRPPQISNIKRDMVPALLAAKQARVAHVVFLSIIGVENMTFVPHYKVEVFLREQNFQTTFLRCSFFMQNLSTVHRKEIQERNEIFVPVGNAKTSFIDVRDIGAVAAHILTEERHAGRSYDLTGAEALDYWQVARILSETLGREIKYRNPGAIRFLIESIRKGASISYAFVVLGLYTSTRYGMAEAVIHEVERITGNKPISFKQFCEDYKDAWL